MTPPLFPGSYKIKFANDFLDKAPIEVTVAQDSTVNLKAEVLGIAVVDAKTSNGPSAKIRFLDEAGELVKTTATDGGSTETMLPAGDYAVELQYSDDLAAGYQGRLSIVSGVRSEPLSVNLAYSELYKAKRIGELNETKAGTIDAHKKKLKGIRIAMLSVAAGGAAYAAFATTSYLIGKQSFVQYTGAATTGDATAARSQAEMWSNLFTVGISAGVALLVAAPVIWLGFEQPATRNERRSIESLDEQIRQLQQQRSTVIASNK